MLKRYVCILNINLMFFAIFLFFGISDIYSITQSIKKQYKSIIIKQSPSVIIKDLSKQKTSALVNSVKHNDSKHQLLEAKSFTAEKFNKKLKQNRENESRNLLRNTIRISDISKSNKQTFESPLKVTKIPKR